MAHLPRRCGDARRRPPDQHVARVRVGVDEAVGAGHVPERAADHAAHVSGLRAHVQQPLPLADLRQGRGGGELKCHSCLPCCCCLPTLEPWMNSVTMTRLVVRSHRTRGMCTCGSRRNAAPACSVCCASSRKLISWPAQRTVSGRLQQRGSCACVWCAPRTSASTRRKSGSIHENSKEGNTLGMAQKMKRTVFTSPATCFRKYGYCTWARQREGGRGSSAGVRWDKRAP